MHLIGIVVVLLLIWFQRSQQPSIHMYVINLPRHKDRRENFVKHYEQTNKKPPLTIVEGVDGSVMKETALFKNWPGLTDKHTGYKGVQLSTVKCLELATKQSPVLDWAIICEDDAVLPADIDFYKIVEQYHGSKVIYLDDRNGLQNAKGRGVVPDCCTCCVMYHKSVFADMIKELHPNTSTHLAQHQKVTKRSTLTDWYIAWLIQHRLKIPCSSHPIVPRGEYKSTL